MKLRYATALMVLATSTASLAQEVFDPTNPFSLPPLPTGDVGSPPPLPNLPGTPQTDSAVPNLPGIDDDEEFRFFQPGYQNSSNTDTQDVIVEEAEPVDDSAAQPVQQTRRIGRLPVIRYNYKQQILPQRIYNHQYDVENKHLPTRRTQAGYDDALFKAVQRNDLNATRAMIEHGGRSLQLVDPAGYSLVEIATLNRAQEVLRYLLAKGAPSAHSGYRVAEAQTLHSEAALDAAQRPYFPQ